MTPQELDKLRKDVKKRMIDLGLERARSYHLIVPHLNQTASVQILCNALTGYRNGPAAQALLQNLWNVLQGWPPDRVSPCGEHIHEGARQNN